MYHPQVFGVDVIVAPDRRGRGIGARLHDRLLADLEPYRPIKRLGRIRADDPAAAAFVAARGYRETKRDVLSALDLHRFEPARWRHVIDDVRAQGITLVTLADVRGDPARVRAYYEQFSTVRADAPRSLPATPIEFSFFVTEVVDQPDAVASATILAFDGERCIGFTQVYASEASEELQTGLTGVDRSYRRRGIATALKAQSLAAAKALGAPSIRTDNDARNTGMLAVNDAFGFDRRPGMCTVAWEAEGA
jgi:GNAT superfamily N-acetyltransferase